MLTLPSPLCGRSLVVPLTPFQALIALRLLCFVILSAPAASGLTLLGELTEEAFYGFPLSVELYVQQQDNLTIDIPLGLSSSNAQALLSGDVDFSLISQPLSLAQALAFPTAVTFPLLASAVVPVYRLDALDPSVTLVLSGSSLALIYTGVITWWNDSRLAADNSGALMPSQPIIVIYQNDSRVLNMLFTTALAQFEPSVADVLPASQLPRWPTHLYVDSRPALGLSGAVGLSLDLDGALGFSTQQAALVANANMANMINRAGLVVQPAAASVSFTVFEMLTAPTALPTVFPSLTDCAAAGGWPLVSSVWLLLDNTASPRGCEARAATVNFFLWFFLNTEVVTDFLQDDYGLVKTPPLLLDRFDVIDSLTALTCDGEPVDVLPIDQLPSMLVPKRLQLLLDSVVYFHQLVPGGTDFGQTSLTASQAVTTAQLSGQLALFSESELAAAVSVANATATALDYTAHWIVPTFLTSLVLIYNPQLSDSLALASSVELTLDWLSIARLLSGNLSDWRDPALLLLNPALAAALDGVGEAMPISLVLGCAASGDAPLLLQLLSRLEGYAAQFDPGLLELFAGAEASVRWAPLLQCAPAESNWQFAVAEDTVQSMVLNQAGSVGYMLDSSALPGNGKFSMQQLLKVSDGSVSSVKRQSTPEGLRACASNLNLSTLQLSVDQAQLVSECWPMTDVVYALVRKDYPLVQAEDALATLSWLAWSINSTTMRAWSDSTMLVQVGSLPLIRQPLMTALNSVTSGGQTLLVTQPVVWLLTDSIMRLAAALATIGGVTALAALAFIARHASHAVYRASAPTFVYISLIGVLSLFAAMALLAVQQPIDSVCSALNWTAQLGFTLLFAPLFLKAYRVYRIFAGRKLRVVKIANSRLLRWLAAVLAADVAYLSIWQAVAPISAVVTLQLSTVDLREHAYQQCSLSASTTSYNMFMASAAVKVTWLLVGVLLAFSTRGVSDAFNEGKAVALAIYNAVLALGVIGSLLALIDAVGDTRTMLLLFGLAWVAFFTLGILTVPKLLQFRKVQTSAAAAISPGQPETGGPDDGSSAAAFSFVNVEQLGSAAAVHSYVMALERHIVIARAHLARVNKAPHAGVVSPATGSRSVATKVAVREKRSEQSEQATPNGCNQ